VERTKGDAWEMKAKEYNLIAQCVETGVMLGWNREHIREQIERAVLNEICEWFDFEDMKNEEV
jgi:hypothetical protein